MSLYALFGTQLPRLDREFMNVQELAQELKSMLGSRGPIELGPEGLQMVNRYDNPAVTIEAPETPGFPPGDQITINQGDITTNIRPGGINFYSNYDFSQTINIYPIAPVLPPPGGGGGGGGPTFNFFYTIIIDEDGNPQPVQQCPPFIGWVQLDEELRSGQGNAGGKLFGWDPVDKQWLAGGAVLNIDGELFRGKADAGEKVVVIGDCKRKRLKAIGSAGWSTADGDPLYVIESITALEVAEDCTISVTGWTGYALTFLDGALIDVLPVEYADGELTEGESLPGKSDDGGRDFVDPGTPPYSPGGGT